MGRGTPSQEYGEGECDPSIAYICVSTRLSERTVQRTISKLAAMGLIDVVIRGTIDDPRSNLFRLNYDTLVAALPGCKADKAESGDAIRAKWAAAKRRQRNKSPRHGEWMSTPNRPTVHATKRGCPRHRGTLSTLELRLATERTNDELEEQEISEGEEKSVVSGSDSLTCPPPETGFATVAPHPPVPAGPPPLRAKVIPNLGREIRDRIRSYEQRLAIVSDQRTKALLTEWLARDQAKLADLQQQLQ